MKTQAYLLFDERMSLHRPVYDPENEGYYAFENPDRIFKCYGRLKELERRLAREQVVSDTSVLGMLSSYKPRFVEFPCKPVERETAELAHSKEHYDWLYHTSFLSEKALRNLTDPDDLYICPSTFLAASLACGGVVQCVDAVTSKENDAENNITRAIALVRPPGHHALKDEAIGFCFFNNVAVSAKHAIHTKRAKRVFIVDWDIHHGNGIQDLTYDDPNIFYLSIHRASFSESKKHKEEWFYPGTGRATEVGDGSGNGSNLNIYWPNSGMGDSEYAAAFSELVLPALSAFQPDLVMVACGLDAAKGDLLGDCGLSPDMYYIMTKSLLDQAGADIPFVVVLEGGYNINLSAECMENVALAVLDEPCRDGQYFSLSRYWKANSYSKLSNTEHHTKKSKAKKRRTEMAVSCIKQSARALADAEGGYYFPAAAPMAFDTPFKPSYSHFGPLKKRKAEIITVLEEPETTSSVVA